VNLFTQHCCRTALLLAIGPVLFSPRIFAQTASAGPTTVVDCTASAPKAQPPAHRIETSVSVGAAAQLSATRIDDTKTTFMTQSLAPSAEVFATFRQSFQPWLGYSVNFGYTRPTYRYIVSAPASSSGPTNQTFVPTNMFEISLSYIAQKHLTENAAAFAELGAGTIAFEAIHGAGDFQNRSNAFLPEGVTGFGIDYRLAHHLGLRAEYRGLFTRYPYPDYVDSTRLHTLISAPTLSVTYNFGKHSQR